MFVVTAKALGQFRWNDLGHLPNPVPITATREWKALIGQAWVICLLLPGEPQGEKNSNERRENGKNRGSGCDAHINTGRKKYTGTDASFEADQASRAGVWGSLSRAV